MKWFTELENFTPEIDHMLSVWNKRANTLDKRHEEKKWTQRENKIQKRKKDEIK